MFAKTFAFFSVLALSVIAVPVLQRRAYTGEVTYFTPGLGACGITNTDTELVAAVSATFFDTYPGAGANPNLNPLCNKPVLANYEGKSVTVKIVDRCTWCNTGFDLDMTMVAMTQLVADPVAVGRLTGVTWDFVDAVAVGVNVTVSA